MDMTMISAALGTLTHIRNAAEGLVELRDQTKLAEVRFALLKEVGTAYSQVLALQEQLATDRETIGGLRDDLRQLKDAKTDRERYELGAVGETGALAYVFKGGGDLHQPPHALCQPCFDAAKKVVLQPSINGNQLICAADSNHTLRVSAIQYRVYVPSPLGRVDQDS